MSTTEAFVAVMVVGMTCGIPLLGLTIRFSFKPLVEAYIRLREAQLGSSQLQSLQQRVAYLERELELLRLTERTPSPALQLSAPEHLPVPSKDRV
jgi:hypothetical protein